MTKVKYIKQFLFGSAIYNVCDSRGNMVTLKINYKDNKYTLVGNGKNLNALFRSEIDQVANRLLLKKHGVNFVKRLKK